ncbi:MAG: flagellar basal body rod protein FlgG [Bacillota bacterium]|nr:flagellar basal body rod protein FlgG [Bacillota bacterium]
MRVLWNSKAGMQAQQDKMDLISNNMANMETEGYKRIDASFKDLVYEKIAGKGVPMGSGALASVKGTGSKLSESYRSFNQGSLKQTGIDTDLAIDGNGFFQVKMADGSLAYKRGGKFNLDKNGNLSDDKGNILQIDYNNDKKINSSSIIIDESGQVYSEDKVAKTDIGKINIYDFKDKANLISIGNDLFKAPAGNEALSQDFSIRQGYLELSNVDLSKEMTDLILAQRAFELNSKGLSTADEMMSMANNLTK